MPTITVHAAPPEHIIKNTLEILLKDCALHERKIDIPVIHGHPLYVEGITEKSFDRNFPKIGVEWTRDRREDYLGQNYRRFQNNQTFQTLLKNYKQTPPNERTPSDAVLDALLAAPSIEYWSHRADSEIIICGFASGGSGRNTIKFIYETIDSLLAPLAADIAESYPGVKVQPAGEHRMIDTDQFATPVWGFEIPINVVQIRKTFRSLPEKKLADKLKFDIHLTNSRTIFDFLK